MMKWIFVWIQICLPIVIAEAAETAALQDVLLTQPDGNIRVDFLFDQELPPSTANLEMRNGEIVIRLPEASSAKPEYKIEQLPAEIIKLAVTKPAGEMLKIRMELSNKADLVAIKDDVRLTNSGKHLFLELPRPKELATEPGQFEISKLIALTVISEEKLPVVAQAANEEEKIAVFAPKKSKTATDNHYYRFLFALGFVLVLLALGRFGVRYAKKRAPKIGKHNEIKVLVQHPMGNKKSLAIIRVAGESILIGITEQNINLIKSLSLLDEDIPQQVPTNFSSQIEADIQPESNLEEQFAVSGLNEIRQMVTQKIKSLRNVG